jgi:hypothetical protein
MRSGLQRALPGSSLTFRLRLAKAIGELDSACRIASQGSWHDLDRLRAREIATTLAQTCELEGFESSATPARSLTFLMRLPRQQILEVGAPFGAKVEELLSSLRSMAGQVLAGFGS